MLNRIITDKLYCGLDIGSQRIKAGIMRFSDAQEGELLGVYENKIQGFKDFSVSDLGEFSDCIQRTLAELATKTNTKIKDIQLGVGGELIDFRSTSTVIPLVDKDSKVITVQDLKKRLQFPSAH